MTKGSLITVLITKRSHERHFRSVSSNDKCTCLLFQNRKQIVEIGVREHALINGYDKKIKHDPSLILTLALPDGLFKGPLRNHGRTQVPPTSLTHRWHFPRAREAFLAEKNPKGSREVTSRFWKLRISSGPIFLFFFRQLFANKCLSKLHDKVEFAKMCHSRGCSVFIGTLLPKKTQPHLRGNLLSEPSAESPAELLPTFRALGSSQNILAT